SDGRSGMRSSVRGGRAAAPSPLRKAEGGEAGRSKVVSCGGATKAVPTVSTRAVALAIERSEAGRGDLGVRVMELTFLGATTSVRSKRDSAEGSEKFTQSHDCDGASIATATAAGRRLSDEISIATWRVCVCASYHRRTSIGARSRFMCQTT